MGSEGKRAALIIFPGALGDLICLLPTIRAIVAQEHDRAIALMARYELARLAVGRTPVSRAWSIDRAEVAQLFMPAAERSRSEAFFADFATIHCFFAADNPTFRDALQLAGRNVRFYPFRPPGRGHVAAAYLEAIGANPRPSPQDARLELVPEDRTNAADILSRIGIAPHSFLLVLPGSGSESKNWPVDNFLSLTEMLRPAMPSLWVLGPAEANLATVLRKARIPMLDGLELGELAGIAALARVFVGNDSGVSHLAAAVGTRGVVMFGPTDPMRWRPLGAVQVLQGDPITKIIVNEVADAVSSANSDVCQIE